MSEWNLHCIMPNRTNTISEVVLADLIKAFKLSPPKKEIVWNLGGIIYPTVDRTSMNPSMPMRVERVIASH